MSPRKKTYYENSTNWLNTIRKGEISYNSIFLNTHLPFMKALALCIDNIICIVKLKAK
jgi:phosphohistidine phosphatase SixA